MRYESASPRRAMTIGEWTGHLLRVLAVLRGGEPLSAGSMPAYDRVIVSDIAAHNQGDSDPAHPNGLSV
jgi:hypothetical protein